MINAEEIKSYIIKGDDFFKASQLLLSNGLFNSSFFTLFHSIEIYLKVILLKNNRKERGHDLVELLKAIKEVDNKVNSFLSIIKGGRNVEEWIKFINCLGSKNGGIRYVQEDKNIYALPNNIYYCLKPIRDYLSQ